MKKASRFGIITGILLVLIALIWSGFSWHRIHNDFEHIGHEGYTAKQATFDGSSVQNIKVDVGNVSVAVKTQTDVSRVTVAYFETRSDKFSVTGSDGTISISRSNATDNPTFFCFFRCIGTPNSITIYVPATSAYSYDLTAQNAAVAFKNAGTLKARAIHVLSSNSNVRLQHITANGTMHLQSSNGSIRLQEVTAGDTISLKSSNASNSLINVQAPVITSQTDNGSATLDSVITKNLTVNTSNASITLNRLAADHSTLTSDNGGVSGTLVGSKSGYNTKISSSNGSIQIDGDHYDGAYFAGGSNSAKSLSVRTSNASVRLTFVK